MSITIPTSPYTVLTSRDMYALASEVSRFMLDGWIPVGGLCCASAVVDGKWLAEYSQALKKGTKRK